jgi:Tfp pilus assembly protein PilV
VNLHPARRDAGFVLVEVLVALLVSTVAVVALAGLHSTQRGAAGHARQLGEALRSAQAALELARSPASDGDAQAGILAAGEAWASDTIYARELTVTPAAAALRAATVRVGWTDRLGAPRSVALHTLVSSAAPDLIGSRLAEQTPSELQPAPLAAGLPAGAVDRGDGTHRFDPPGGGGVWWRLDSASGEVLETCAAGEACQPRPALLVHGHVRFAPGTDQPGPAQAENPPGPTRPIEVRLALTRPQRAEVECFESRSEAAVTFHCAVPLPAQGPRTWSGRIVLAGLPWAVSVADADATAWRVCRYEAGPESTGQRGLPVTGVAPGQTLEAGAQHTDVGRALLHRNFLVIRAGDGLRAFGCPGDDPATPWLDGRTWHHQPPS